MTCPQVADGGNDLQIWIVAVNMLKKKSRNRCGVGTPVYRLTEGINFLVKKKK
jgi:hypothetical protein